MTANGAFYNFFAGFDIPIYEESTCPDEREMSEMPETTEPAESQFPYLTYSADFGSWSSGETSVVVNLWYRDGKDWLECDAKAREILRAIGLGGITLECDDGLIWLKYGSPLMQNLRDPQDDKIRRKYINLSADFLTKY